MFFDFASIAFRHFVGDKGVLKASPTQRIGGHITVVLIVSHIRSRNFCFLKITTIMLKKLSYLARKSSGTIFLLRDLYQNFNDHMDSFRIKREYNSVFF